MLANGLVWASADVEMCNGPGISGAPGPDAWQLTSGNSRVKTTDGDYGNALIPAFDVYLEVAEGTCLRGWVLFEVPPDLPVDGVTFTMAASGPQPVWTLAP